MSDYAKTIENLREAAKGLLFDAMPYRASVMRDAADTIEELRRNLKDCRNQLCETCGKYIYRHRGACDGCRWKEPIE